MPIQPGQKLPGAGRPKGSKNKKRVLRVEETLVELEVNPIKKILELLPLLKPSEQAETLLKLVPYYQAPIKINEEEVEEDDGEELPEAALLQLAKVK